MMDFLLVIGGLLLLVLAGDSLVRGAVALSLRLGVPALIVSATVVAFGTSAPELLISVQAALEGAPGIALGNVVGSNIANVWLVLGVPALIAPMAGCGEDAKRSLYFMLAATAVFVALLMPGVLWWWGGLILLAITALMVADSIRHALAHRAAEAALASGSLASGSVGAAAATAGGAGGHDQDLAELEDIDPNMPTWKVSAFIVGGMVGLPLGAQLLIDGARGIALDFGVSEAAIGVTLVAIGTSLPELATTVMAAMRRQADVAIGNVVGSNLFNITAIIGTAALFAPMDVPAEIMQRDVWVMVAATLMLAPFALFCRTICRVAGSAFLLLYIGYVVVALS